MKKRIISAIIAVIMTLSVVAFIPSFAEGSEEVVVSAGIITVNSIATEADVAISVHGVNSEGLISAVFNVKVECATIVSGDGAAELPEGGYAVVGPTDKSATDGVNFMWVDSATGLTSDSPLAVFHVALPSGAECGAEYPVVITLSDDPQDFTALDGETDVPASVVNGKIVLTHSLTHIEAKEATKEEDGNVEYWYCENCGKYFTDEEATVETDAESVVVKYVPAGLYGDVNGDGKVNSRDVIAVMKAVVAGTTAEELPAADLNEDSKINSRDVIAVMKAVLNAQG